MKWVLKVTDDGIELVDLEDDLIHGTITGITPEAQRLIEMAPDLLEFAEQVSTGASEYDGIQLKAHQLVERYLGVFMNLPQRKRTYAERVLELEAEGMPTSDAQGCADIEAWEGKLIGAEAEQIRLAHLEAHRKAVA